MHRRIAHLESHRDGHETNGAAPAGAAATATELEVTV